MTVNNEDMEDEGQLKIVPATSINFERKNDLQKVLRRADKGMESAFKLLEDIIKDDKAEQKLKIDAAKFLIEKRIAVSSEIAKDQLSRAIAQSRLILAERATQQRMLKNAGAGSAEDDEEYATPKYCPDMILDHSTVKEM